MHPLEEVKKKKAQKLFNKRNSLITLPENPREELSVEIVKATPESLQIFFSRKGQLYSYPDIAKGLIALISRP